jgi:hypothetical protein
MISRSAQALHQLFESKPVVQLSDIQSALGGASRSTAFRHLRLVPYRRSYSHNGRYYTRHDASRYDRFGLFSHEGIHFSQEGNLTATLLRLVYEAEAGRTHRELRELLRVRVQVSLQQAVDCGTLARERLEKLFVYLHCDARVRRAQLRRRVELYEAQTLEAAITDAEVIDVLLTLVHHPGSRAGDVVRRLRGRSPPITLACVRAIFERYHLDRLGEKGGRSSC